MWAFLCKVNRILRGHCYIYRLVTCNICKDMLAMQTESQDMSPSFLPPPLKQLLMFRILQPLLLMTLPCFIECKTLSIVRCTIILCKTNNFLSCQLNSDMMLYHWNSFTLTKILLLILIRHRWSHITCVDTCKEKQQRLFKMVLKWLHI